MASIDGVVTFRRLLRRGRKDIGPAFGWRFVDEASMQMRVYSNPIAVGTPLGKNEVEGRVIAAAIQQAARVATNFTVKRRRLESFGVVSKRFRKGRGGELVTLRISGLPGNVTERDVKAVLLDRGAGRVASISLSDASSRQARTVRARLSWRSARKVMSAPAVEGGWELTFHLEDSDS